MARKLLIIRGNSGSGKTTLAETARAEILRRGFARQVALVEQDYVRRIVLKEKEAEGSNNLGLLRQTVLFCLAEGYDVVLEGILRSERYRELLSELVAAADSAYLFYLDVSFSETLRRHRTKPNAHEFGEREMREWFRERDVLGVENEEVLGEALSADDAVERIVGRAYRFERAVAGRGRSR
jgi:predicted kinase